MDNQQRDGKDGLPQEGVREPDFSWTPMSYGGVSVCTHRLVEVSPKRVEFRRSSAPILSIGLLMLFVFPLLFLAIDSTILALMGDVPKEFWFVPLAFFPSAMLFFGVAVWIYMATRPRVFDLSTGWFWKGRQPRNSEDIDRRKNCAFLKEIVALQIVGKTVSEQRVRETGQPQSYSTFHCYEINLVLNTGERINVIAHGKLAAIRADAARLGEFLNVPVWNR